MSLSNYVFAVPTKVKFGAGVIETVGEEAKALGAAKVLVVADQGLIKAGLVAKVEDSLKKEQIPYVIYDKIVPNPRDTDCQAGSDFAKKEGIDCIVTMGGGSSMDTAKAIGTMMTNDGELKDHYGMDNVQKDIPPLIAIPTTAGTGSEVTPYAVITDTTKDYHEKYQLASLRIAPKVALVDPAVLMGLPAHVMASCGIDALVHAVEGYTCKVSTPHTEAMALYAIEKISKSLRKACKERTLKACADVMLGSTLAGIVEAGADCASVHCMAEPVGALYDIPHGVSNAVFFALVEEFNMSADWEKHARVAQAMGVDTHGMTVQEAAKAGITAIEQLCRDLDMPKFRDLPGVKTSDFEQLAEMAERNFSTPSNVRDVTKADYLELFWKAYNE